MTTNNANGNQPQGPLSGIRVIDWTMWQFGPVSTMMLADLGADVIKVESLDGDHGRQFGRVGGVGSDMPEGVNAYFEGMNRNKRGIALDLEEPARARGDEQSSSRSRTCSSRTSARASPSVWAWDTTT